MKRINNQSGFTVIELVLSFVFVFTIALSMFELLFNYRQRRDEESVRLQMQDYSSEITLAIQKDITERVLKSIDYCKSNNKIIPNCLKLYFNDNTNKELSVEEDTTTYDVKTNYIKYGKITYKPDDAPLIKFKSDYILDRTYEEDNLSDNSIIYKINIPITHNDLGDEDFGIKVVAIGYDYDAKAGTAESGSATTADGKEFMSTTRTTCKTRIYAKENIKYQTIVARFKGSAINDDGKSNTVSAIVSNMNFNGSSVIVEAQRKTEYTYPTNRYILDPPRYRLCYYYYFTTNSGVREGVCLQTESNPGVNYSVWDAHIYKTNRWYTVIATFDGTGDYTNGLDPISYAGKPTFSIFVYDPTTGRVEERHSRAKSATELVNTGSKAQYSIGSEAGTAVNLAHFDGTISQVLVYNGTSSGKVLTPANARSCLLNNTGNVNAIKRNCLNDSVFESEKILDYDFTNPTTYTNKCYQ